MGCDSCDQELKSPQTYACCAPTAGSTSKVTATWPCSAPGRLIMVATLPRRHSGHHERHGLFIVGNIRFALHRLDPYCHREWRVQHGPEGAEHDGPALPGSEVDEVPRRVGGPDGGGRDGRGDGGVLLGLVADVGDHDLQVEVP